MSKGEQTRDRIIQHAAELFNKHGYQGAAMSELMAATGLQKGGIYRHFSSKDQLAALAFDYAQRQSTERLEAALASQTDAIAQLLAFVEAFCNLTTQPPVPGGCPIMNTIVDSDDGDGVLYDRVLAVVSHWQLLLENCIVQGIQRGQIRPNADPQALAAIMIATIEGGILLSRAHRKPIYVQYAVDHLKEIILNLAV